MAKPLFRNDRPYRVQVPTPSGSGRIIAPGKCVEGDYFLSSWRANKQLTLLTESEAKKINRALIEISISVKESDSVMSEVTPPQMNLNEEAEKNKQVKEKNKEARKVLNQGLADTTLVLPTVEDMKKMKLPELKELAGKLNISSVGNREDIEEQIKKKMSEIILSEKDVTTSTTFTQIS